MALVNPYLNFNGNCKEAFDFYKAAFGTEFEMAMRFSDVPADAQQEGPAMKPDEIMHISLPIGKGTYIMGSDVPEAYGPVSFGSNFNISIGADSKEEADKLFNALSAGGKVTMPMADAFWGSYFGMFEDKFGIAWMISFDNKQQ